MLASTTFVATACDGADGGGLTRESREFPHPVANRAVAKNSPLLNIFFNKNNTSFLPKDSKKEKKDFPRDEVLAIF